MMISMRNTSGTRERVGAGQIDAFDLSGQMTLVFSNPLNDPAMPI
jgi:hypothetical protein